MTHTRLHRKPPRKRSFALPPPDSSRGRATAQARHVRFRAQARARQLSDHLKDSVLKRFSESTDRETTTVNTEGEGEVMTDYDTETVVGTLRLAGAAAEKVSELADRLADTTYVTLRIGPNEKAETVQVPKKAFDRFGEVLWSFARGQQPAVVPADFEITSEQAAKLLNVSRPYATRLLDDDRIPGVRREGSHRRVGIGPVLAYRNEDDVRRRSLLEKLDDDEREDGD